MFDLGFMYKQDIWPKNIWDGMIAEKLIWLGYPTGMREMSLKAAAWNYLQYDLDKTVRGKIINNGLTEDVVVYAAGDVMWIEDIKEKQEIELTKQDLHRAVRFECEFIKSLAYFKHCGIYLDPVKWKAKMKKDQERLVKAKEALNNWVVNWFESQNADEHSTTIEVSYIEGMVPENFKDRVYDRIEETNLLGQRKLIYKVPLKEKFVYRNLQGSLFEGFDTRLKCNINWASSKQVIPLFELLGIKVKTFDKKTKREKKSIEEKQIAEQNALKAKYDLERIKTEAEQAVTKAKGEAEAMKLKNEQISQNIIYLEFINKWDGKMPTYYGSDNLFLGLDMNKSQSANTDNSTKSE